MLISFATPCADADTVPAAVNHLPGPPSSPDPGDADGFKLRDVSAKLPAGSVISGAPMTVIDMLNGMGDWATVEDKDLPPFPRSMPADLKGRVQYFTASNDAGWMIVPRGWKLWRAAMGADGNTWFSYVAPTGPKDGWVVTGEIPGCVGCMLSEADGIIPGAHKKLIDAALAQPGSRQAELVPKPSMLSMHDPCTAVFTYDVPGSPHVFAALYLGPGPEGGDIERALYVALPESEIRSVNYMMVMFLVSLPPCTAASR